MNEFLFIKECTNKLGVWDSIISFIHGYKIETQLGIDFYDGPRLEGYVVKTHHKQWDKLISKFKFKVLGLEGYNSWNFVNARRDQLSDIIISPGINLNLAVNIHNIKRSLEGLKSINPKIKLAITNVDAENGEAISEIFTNIFGDIILVGENQEQLNRLSQKFFSRYGVMVSVLAHLPADRNILVIDINVLKRRIAEMNFLGEYREIQGKHSKEFIFSAYFVEMLVICSSKIDLNKYDPVIINTDNVTAIAKAAKKLGFIPIFSTVQKYFLEHNNVTSSDVEYLP